MALELQESPGRLMVDYRGARTNKTVVALNLFLAVSCSVAVSLVWLNNAQLPPTIRFECERATLSCRDAYQPAKEPFPMALLRSSRPMARASALFGWRPLPLPPKRRRPLHYPHPPA